MAEDKQDRRAANEAPADPNERAFSGHPDHPPMQPDQSPENNRALLGEGARQGDDTEDWDADAQSPS